MSTGTPLHSLEPTFRRWHATIRRMSLLTGAGWCLGAGIALLLAIGLADWRFRLDSVRLRTTLVLVAAAAWGLLLMARVLLPSVRRFRAIDLARQIENSRPHWRGALISSVEFATAGCRPAAGAPALQAALIDDTAARLTEDDLQPLLRREGLRRATTFALATMVVAGAVVIAWPTGAGLALSRIMTPGTAPDWPREHVLVLLDAAFQPIDPLKPAAPRPLGERMTIYVDDPVAGLPEQTLLQISASDGRRTSQSVERTTISDKSGRRREIGVASLRSDSPQLRVRAVGGDDQRMPWHTFEFAPRPTATRYQLTLTPPPYTQQSPQEIVATGGDIAALVGTHVRVEVELERPVREAVLQHTGLAPVPPRLADDGRRITVEFPVPAAAGATYGIDLVGRDGLRAGHPQRFRVEGIPDREPSVALTQPAGDLTVTPQAVVPVHIDARDDLGLVYVRLSSVEPPGSEGEQLQPLPLDEPLAREAVLGTQVSVAALGLEAGRTLVLRAEAADAFNLDGRHVVRSVARTLSVVAPEIKHRELVGRQAGIAELLERAAEWQSRALQQTRSLQLQWRTSSQFSANELDLLRRLAHDQAQLSAVLHDADRGGGAQARGILDELAWNGLQDPAIEDRLGRLETGLARLKSDLSPAMDRNAAEALRHVPNAVAASPEPFIDSLAEVERAQSQANDLLIELAALFGGWQRHHDLTRSLAEIVHEQSQINLETRTLGRRTLTVPLPQLPADDRTALARLGQRQAAAADAVQQLEQRLQRAGAADDSTAAQSLAEPDVEQALAQLSDSDLVPEMQRAAQLVSRNAIAETAEIQQAVAQSLARLEEAIRGLESPTPESLIRRVERAQVEAETLQDRQSQLQSAARSVADSAAGAAPLDDIRTGQQRLAEDTAEWAQRLRRQQLTDVAANAADAAANMAMAAAELVPDELTAALDQQAAAVEELRQTQRVLQAARKALEFDHTMSEWARVAGLIDSFAARQAQLIDEADRLGVEQARKSGLSRAQLRTLLALAGSQGQLAADVAELPEAAGSNPIIGVALAPVVVQMQTAAAALAERRLDDVTREAQQSALEQLRALSGDCQVSTAATGAGGAANAGNLPLPSSWPLTMQLKVLARLQSEVARRASVVRAAMTDVESQSDGQRQELQQLADQQSRLAELLGQLLTLEATPEEP